MMPPPSLSPSLHIPIYFKGRLSHAVPHLDDHCNFPYKWNIRVCLQLLAGNHSYGDTPRMKTEPPLSRRLSSSSQNAASGRVYPEQAVRGEGRAHHQQTRSAKSTLVIRGVTNVGARSPSHPTAHCL